jgi:NadR type nicotinamide-nucleotide adenylyltransferase
METIKRIAVIGPESTGKSTLSNELANFYGCFWVPEFAREYLEKKGPHYIAEDLFLIAEGQLQLEEKFLELSEKNQNNKLFFDTELNVIKVWSEFVFNQCDNRILNKIAEKKYDLYLLCNTDLEWTEDPLREYPDKNIREKLFHFYKDILENQSSPWIIISGNYEERMEKARKFIDANVK